MPTLECLDERTKLILDRLEQMDESIARNFNDFRFAVEERNKLIDKRLRSIEDDVLDLKLKHAEEAGKKSMIMWIGGLALTAMASIFGAIGNILYNWWLKHGPLQ